MEQFKRWNNLIGWLVFAISATVYLMTIEPVSSMWDCSEFIATSYKLEVGHPPGAPLFMMLARLATLFTFGNPEYVGIAVNAMNALVSAFCILFLFWSITHIARRLVTRNGEQITTSSLVGILGSGFVGALAYTFTDTFWFSAIEGEVYALSSMFTALVVWLMLKWEDHADEPHSLKWIVLIAYLMGLSIGVHLLNLLTIPALALIYYFRKTEKVTIKGLILTLILGVLILGFVNNLIIPLTVWMGAMIDVFFVNSLGLPVNSGMVVFSLGLIGGLGWYTYRTHCEGKVFLNTLLLCVTMILVGYSSYASITIRAVANPPMNSNNPDNPQALLSFLNRDQYGDKPLLYGAYFSSPIKRDAAKRKTVYTLNEQGKYEEKEVLVGYEYAPENKHFFPRMWNSQKGERAYTEWGAYRTEMRVIRDEQGNVLRNDKGQAYTQPELVLGKKKTWIDENGEPQTFMEPTFSENLYYFFNYQLNYMYWRYFLWNFVGRQSDVQPNYSQITDGNWLSGIEWIDTLYTGPQTDLPREIADNKARNTYYFLPFILGLIGLLYQLNRDQRNFMVVMILFIMTGIALVVYFNTSPGEPRERDYVYAGSFYAFCMWIGLGVLALREFFSRLLKRNHWLTGAAATVLALSVPSILAAENWDDHDRSGRTMARDIGWNYLMSTLPNSIILNYGDNDTFPLWNNQEVYGVRPDVRIMNTSYLNGEWYVDEMKCKANDADGVPFTLPRSKYAFTNDWITIYERVKSPVDLKEVIEFVRSDNRGTKLPMGDEMLDYIPTRQFALPVNKDNAIRAGIVKEEDRDKMVDTIYFRIDRSALEKSQLMILDMLAHFDWKRPIYMTQFYMFKDLGLGDYLQFDGYAYRFVPIKTEQTGYEVGRVDPDYAAPLLLNTFRYGNLADPNVYVDFFIQYNLEASRARNAFARVARALMQENRTKEAVELLDAGLEKLPPERLRFTYLNTIPLVEAYYAAEIMGEKGAAKKGDDLARKYMTTLFEYVKYYNSFPDSQFEMVQAPFDDKSYELERLYEMVAMTRRTDLLREMNAKYLALGVPQSELYPVPEAQSEAQPSSEEATKK